MTDLVTIDIDDGVAVLALNRPEARNAVSQALAHALVDELVELDANDDASAIVLTGKGDRAFCAGVDVREAQSVEPADVESWFGAVCEIYRQIILTDKPIVAALNGVAAGAGFQMALVSDLRIAHPGTRMGQPEINAGVPSIMGSYWMTFHLPWSKNQELSYTGRLMDAEECDRLGLFYKVVPAETLLDKACETAKEIGAKPPIALRRTKARFRELALAGFEDAFRAGVLGQQEGFASGEPQAVMARFVESRAKRESK